MCRFQRRRIVYPVPGHCDDLAVCFERFNKTQLLLGKNARENVHFSGSFAQESEAENLKARLALAGWEAEVQPGTLPDKGVRYRVRLGPYDNADELNRIKGQLTQRGFDAAVIKF